MPTSDTEDFQVRTGRARSRGSLRPIRPRSFMQAVNAAVRKAGGNPARVGGAVGKGGGRFNARGRGARAMAAIESGGGRWRQDSSGRFRARRVVVKARVVKMNPQGGSRSATTLRATSKAIDAHLRYLERDGVTPDGEKGRAYSASDNEADGRAFVERGREDRHQFRFIVAPEDAEHLGDLRCVTRDLMRQVEVDLDTQLDWIAVDHHNTGHSHSHIIVRGVTGDGKILNIAGDYIAGGVRHRAAELVTRELGYQSEHEVARKLALEIGAERLTRLDRMLLAEQREEGVVDLRQGRSGDYQVRENRQLLLQRARVLERHGLADEVEPGRWSIADGAETTLQRMGERGDIIKTMHRALEDHGLADTRGVSQYVPESGSNAGPVVGRVLAKGLSDELGGAFYMVVDGVDGQVHHLVSPETTMEEAPVGSIIEAAPSAVELRRSDRNIAALAEENDGVYRPSQHQARLGLQFEAAGKDSVAFVQSHVRRLEALRREGHVERIDADTWRVPADLAERGLRYDQARGRASNRIRVLSTLDLESQINASGATWLDRELTSSSATPLRADGFGRDVADGLERRKGALTEIGLATKAPDGRTRLTADLVERLERSEVSRVGKAMAASRGSPFKEVAAGDYVSGKLAGVTQLTSGRFAMIDDGQGFSLVPWQPVLEKRIDQHVSGRAEATGTIQWSFKRQRGLGL